MELNDRSLKRRAINGSDYLATAGMPPGSLVDASECPQERTRITHICYSADKFEEIDIGPDALPGPDGDPMSVQWVNIESPDAAALEAVGAKYGLHSLLLEDVQHMGQRPKIENYPGLLFAVVKALSREEGAVAVDQMSLVLGHGFVLTFGARRSCAFKPVSDRLRADSGRIRSSDAGFLFHALMDVIVDDYFVVLEDLGEKIENTEDELVTKPTSGTLKDIYGLKRELLNLHKAVWPFREVVGSLERGAAGSLISEAADVYFRDLYDHVIQVMDVADTLRDILSSMLDIYLSSASNRMNEIMKVLTIISTVFIPLTFIVGLYGMNLKGMPEFEVTWWYPVVWGVMIVVAVSMLIYFKRKKWW